MAIYKFNVKDSGIYGKAFEMEIKRALKRKNADKVSPCGTADFRYKNKNYDSKQNGTVIRYNPSSKYIKGSSRVIYASHIACTTVIDGDTISITVDLANTDMYVVDRNDFVKFILENGLTKGNASRGTVNIQSGWNYSKDNWHGRAGKRIEAWAYENDLGDDIIGDILEGLE